MKFTAILFALLAFFGGQVFAAEPAAKPNVLFILCDDLRPSATRREFKRQLATLLAAEGLTPDKDKMPLDQGIKTELPDQKIR